MGLSDSISSAQLPSAFFALKSVVIRMMFQRSVNILRDFGNWIHFCNDMILGQVLSFL